MLRYGTEWNEDLDLECLTLEDLGEYFKSMGEELLKIAVTGKVTLDFGDLKMSFYMSTTDPEVAERHDFEDWVHGTGYEDDEEDPAIATATSEQ